MAAPRRSLAEVQRRVAAVHGRTALSDQLRSYDRWAADYEQDVSVLQYRAPRLAAGALAAAAARPRDTLVLDAACGTGLVAQELQGLGFNRMHGVDGSRGMLEIARQKGLYQELKHCILGQEPLPVPTGQYDAVIIVGALSEGQVPCSVVPELLRVTKPGGFLCLTTRTNVTNLQYLAKLQGMLEDLEEQGLWAKVSTQEVEKWEKATSEQESTQNSDYISGVVYVYRKC